MCWIVQRRLGTRQTASILSVPVDGNAPPISLRVIRLLVARNPNEEWLDASAGAVVHDLGKGEVLEKPQGH